MRHYQPYKKKTHPIRLIAVVVVVVVVPLVFDFQRIVFGTGTATGIASTIATAFVSSTLIKNTGTSSSVISSGSTNSADYTTVSKQKEEQQFDMNDNTIILQEQTEHTNENNGEQKQQEVGEVVVSTNGYIESEQESPKVLQLPPSDGTNENITTIQFGETISFTELGPIIINTDGTTRRIDNWNTLTKKEQETTWRRIQQRNAIRRQQLLEQQAIIEQQQQQQAEQSKNDTNEMETQ